MVAELNTPLCSMKSLILSLDRGTYPQLAIKPIPPPVPRPPSPAISQCACLYLSSLSERFRHPLVLLCDFVHEFFVLLLPLSHVRHLGPVGKGAVREEMRFYHWCRDDDRGTIWPGIQQERVAASVPPKTEVHRCLHEHTVQSNDPLGFPPASSATLGKYGGDT